MFFRGVKKAEVFDYFDTLLGSFSSDMLEMFNFLCLACGMTKCCFGAFPWSFLLLFCMLNLPLGQLPSIRCNRLFLGHRLFVHEMHAIVAEMCMLINLGDVLVKIENFGRNLDVCTLYVFNFRLTSIQDKCFQSCPALFAIS